MTALSPVVERELRVAARRVGTYWGRVGSALAAVVIAGWSIAGLGALALTPQAGRNAFRVLALVSAFMLVNRVIHLTAEAFAREKREDTLGLLFLTPLKPRDLVLGKLASSALGGFYHFIAVIPVLALPMLGGGVTFGDFARLVLVLSNLAFFTAALGLHVSALSWDEKRAASLAMLGFLVFAVVLPFLSGLAYNAAYTFAPVTPFIFGISPGYAVWQAAAAGSVQAPAFWWSLLLTHAGGWLFLRVTCRVLPRCWQERPRVTALHRHARLLDESGLSEKPVGIASAVVALPAQSSPPDQAARRTVRRQFYRAQRAHLLDRNPVVWFALRWRAEATAAWIVGAMVLVGLVCVCMAGNAAFLLSPMFALFVCFILNAAVKTYVATQAGLALARDRAENSLELLLATPLTPRELVRGHIIAVREPLRNLIRGILIIEASLLALTLATWPDLPAEERTICIVIGIATLAFFIPDTYAVGWAALWEGAVAKDSKSAAANAQVKVLVLPWLLVLVLAPLAGALSWPGRTISWLMIGGLVVGSALADWWFARRAQQKLRNGLVELARFRAAGGVTFYGAWERLGGWLGRLWRTWLR